MPSKLKSDTARRNGAKSRGPITEAGKRTSSRNSLKYGIHAAVAVLPNEDAEAYEHLLATFLDEWQPATPTEETLVVDMVSARWRLQRIETLIATTLELEIESVLGWLGDDQDPIPDEALVARAYTRNAVNSKTMEMFERWESRLQRNFQRALKTLRSLQAERQKSPEQPARPQPVTEQTQNKNRQNEPTGNQLPMKQPLTHPLPQTDVQNGHKPLPLNLATPDATPPEIQ